MPTFPLALIRDLYRHMEWADAAVWKAVLASDAARRDDSLRTTLAHLHGVQRAFLDGWTGRPIAFAQPSEFTDTMRVHEWAIAYYPSVRRHLDTLTDQQLDAVFVMPWVSQYEEHLGRTFEATTLGETLYQVVAHTNHHRGQVNTRLRALGAEPPLIDYIIWVYFGRSPAEWPSVSL